ncbi:hypothetical protein ACIRG5_27700 [Lentzea sp. NPDC102401]|uniref:hypothetical protein n=1 Tax=Lentzea sp. NPDC102401 TaxID=3364128 RepID=UPI00381AEA35
MPEQMTLSITVTVAPRMAGGLLGLVTKYLAKQAGETRGKDRTTVVNKSSGPVHGTLFQIGSVHGDVHYRDR